MHHTVVPQKVNTHYNNTTHLSGGFTLVEIMVSLSIFMIIMLVSLGAIITSSNAAKQSQALRSLMNNIDFSLESMTRSLRTGSNYHCIPVGQSMSNLLPDSTDATSVNTDCEFGTTGGEAITFNLAGTIGPRAVLYKRIARNTSPVTYTLQRCNYVGSAETCLDTVSPDVDIQTLLFFVKGSRPFPVDKVQPNIYIIIKGRVIIKGTSTDFAIQTDVAQRSAE